MKRTIVVLALVAVSSYFFSCSRVRCLTPIPYMEFVSDSSIPDTGANVVAYKKGGNFTDMVNSYNNTPLVTQYSPTTKYLDFGVSGNNPYDIYDYDWIITLIPSGKVYKLTNFAHGNSSYRNYGEVRDNCVNSVSCTVNGSPYKINPPSTNSSSANTPLQINY